jgi:phosphoribosylformimino-5-aminoimidazole carboxamide ribotide isomerase
MPRPDRMEVIPALDLLAGGIVRLFQGDFDQVTEYAKNPLELAQSYTEIGVKRLHVVDLDGAKTGQPANLPIISELASLGLEVQAGGGIRTFSQLARLLASGATRVILGSTAVKEPEQVAEWIAAVGPQRVILAFDVRLDESNSPEVLTHGWTRSSGEMLWPLVEYFLDKGATEFLCTDISKDGTLQGPNFELYRVCADRYPGAEFIASGGISCAEDLRTLDATGVTRAVTGKALLDGRLTVEEIKQFSRGE